MGGEQHVLPQQEQLQLCLWDGITTSVIPLSQISAKVDITDSEQSVLEKSTSH